MPLLELEKAGLNSLLAEKIKDAAIAEEKCIIEYEVDNQHPAFYDRVRGEIRYAQGLLKGLQQAKELTDKYL